MQNDSSDKSLRVIIEAASYHPKLKAFHIKTYEDLMYIPFGRPGYLFIQTNMFILAYGAMVAYLLIIKDTVPTIFNMDGEAGFINQREIVMMVTSLVIILPLSLMRDMASLSFTSFLSVSADTVLVTFIAVFAPIKDSLNQAGGFWTVLKGNTINSHLFIGLGIISTAMACQHSAFIVNGSFDDRTSARWATVTGYSLMVALGLCAVMGAVGFLGFLGETEGDILNNFDPDTVAANAARGLLAFTMFFTYPMECFVARHVIAQVFFQGNSEGEYEDADGNKIYPPKLFGCIGRREKMVIGIYIATMIPALIVDSLGPVLSITGSIGGSCVAYIGPGLAYLGVHGERFIEYTDMLLGKKTHVDPNVELPVAGDANATMSETYGQTDYECKPFWWYLLGFPIWRAIASSGAMGMKMRLDQFEEDHPGILSTSLTGEVVGPITRDYYMSMFFISFGVVAGLVGVASNVYVELKNLFFTPY